MRNIVIKGEHIMHGIYITVIFILAIALIFKSSNGGNGSHIEDIDEDEEPAQILKDASVKIIKNTHTNPTSTVVVPTSPSSSSSSSSTSNDQQSSSDNETDDTNTAQDEDTEEELLPITGQLSFFIDKITKEEKGEDWGKVVEIKFTIVNQKPTSFYPKVLIYLWDDNDEADIRTYVEEEIYFDKLEPGESLTEEKEVSISFNEIDEEKTLKAVLYDEDDEELDVEIEKFTLS